ncbi:MAG: aminomethyl-transferring glycine dehydrogenase [Flavobacteriales bacterium]|nr:aminomethyl-transferring glycine dehydrogenase [Flavobacteriales bacterium]
MPRNNFASRHIGPSEDDLKTMLKSIGVKSLDQLIDETVPEEIRLKTELNLPDAMSEFEYLEEIKGIATKNKIFHSFIGMGYYECIVPSTILRNIMENPSWYTAYTPYQSEISQGRMEALLNFQTMVCDLTGMEIANASLLDEGTAAAEAMLMMYRIQQRKKDKKEANTFFISNECFPQTIDILQTRAEPLNIKLIIGDYQDFKFTKNIFGAFIQCPTADGDLHDYSTFISNAHKNDTLVGVAADILSLTLLTPPGEWGADVVVGSTQRLGVPLGFGGPHAAFFATKNEFQRYIPGRIIGLSVDSNGNPALRMALQTREQHIKREKATSNICTSQVLLAVMASMYVVYHGPKGLKLIAERINNSVGFVMNQLKRLGYKCASDSYFDTIKIALPVHITKSHLQEIAIKKGMNFRYFFDNHVGISLDETSTIEVIHQIIEVFAEANDRTHENCEIMGDFMADSIPKELQRKSDYMSHPVFNSYHSESALMRYMKKLEHRDISLTQSMIPLGSCTMKLNAASELIPISWPEFASLHPFKPEEQAIGYLQIIQSLRNLLCEITGFAGVSFQPNSGAQGEYAGLMVIREYHKSRGEGHRSIMLIPSSAHGTNPASAVLAGMKVVIVKCDELGNIDVAELKSKAEEHAGNLAGLMVTYPSTHGVFEASIIDITSLIHKNGGQVYMDGANMNAQIGLTSPGLIGADVCHLNLHKTFAIPHGGGGPGVGPICVAEHLEPFLPSHSVVHTGGRQGVSPISSAQRGSALILLISYGYLKMLGREGIINSTKYAILNANYIKKRLEEHYPILYSGTKGRVAHELIADCRSFKESTGIEVEDIAKRLIDYGYHAPTVSFPVVGTLMIEPTESESLEEIDRFCDVMISIREEIREIEEGKADRIDNVLKNAPHTAESVTVENWTHSYSREKAAYPKRWIRDNKFWPFVGRVDNATGDRNLICSCPPVEDYN